MRHSRRPQDVAPDLLAEVSRYDEVLRLEEEERERERERCLRMFPITVFQEKHGEMLRSASLMFDEADTWSRVREKVREAFAIRPEEPHMFCKMDLVNGPSSPKPFRALVYAARTLKRRR